MLPLPRHKTLYGEEKIGGRRRLCVEPTDDQNRPKLLCAWPEQLEYEEICPLVLFAYTEVL